MTSRTMKAEKDTRGGIALNEDCTHYFGSRAGQRLDAGKVASWVDQFAGTQVEELILNPNSMRTSYASKVWDPFWRGYDPNGPDDQPFLKSRPPKERVQFSFYVTVYAGRRRRR